MMLSGNARRLNFCLMYLTKPIQAFLPVTPGVLRGLRALSDVCGKFLGRVPSCAAVEPVSAGGVPGEWVTCGNDIDRRGVILYLHGGGYFFCSPATHRPLTWRLARGTNTRVLSLDYRMAPAFTIDDCRADAVKAYSWLLERGYAPGDIVVGGDSAGGGLTLLTLLTLRDRGLPLPRAAFCLSPFADLSQTSPTLNTNARTCHMFHQKILKKVEAFLTAGRDPYDPMLSPAFGDFAGLPPLFIQVADSEMLLNDSLVTAARAEQAGVAVDLRVWHNLPHVFTLFADILPEGKQGIDEIIAFVNRHLYPRQ
jgi:acetyl esterase/lipase